MGEFIPDINKNRRVHSYIPKHLFVTGIVYPFHDMDFYGEFLVTRHNASYCFFDYKAKRRVYGYCRALLTSTSTDTSSLILSSA